MTVRSDAYSVRQFDAGDRDTVLSLFERALYPDLGDLREAWFTWRFEDNPNAPDVPITVVERDGVVVAAESNLPIRMTVGGRPELAILQAESVVHEDHRRRGVFSRMYTHDEAYYAEREPVISIGTPLDVTMRALEKRGDQIHLDRGVAFELPKYYRCRNPAVLADGTGHERLASALRLTAPVVRLGLAALEAISLHGGGLSSRRHVDVPVDLLATLAERGTDPARVHAVRDRPFYEWRFANPRCEYVTYTAWRGDAPVAIVVTETQRDHSPAVVRIVDVLPAAGDGGDRHALSWLLREVVRDVAPNPVFALGSLLPGRALFRHGFYPNSAPPLAWLTKPTTVLARPLDGGGSDEEEWTLNGCRLCDPSSWQLSWADVSFG